MNVSTIIIINDMKETQMFKTLIIPVGGFRKPKPRGHDSVKKGWETGTGVFKKIII